MPASGEVLLDTSVVVPYFRGDAVIGRQVRACTTLYLPQTALGELYCGAYLSTNQTKTLAEITSFLAAVTILSPGLVTADHYGRIRAALAKAGTPIPENDIWIAAIAKEFQLPVAARDAHFDQVAGLQVLKW
ncbi:MAG: type II toxin-antitoxin system VapC family toxin [Verrucomicrobia bacterium]|nr:type II toxin-antitoxin system VapC family toxin [Verrucomicrobiota bacterium]